MIYQFEHEEIKQCEYCKLCNLNFDWCNMQSCLIDKYESPEYNDCPLVAISKTETTSCEWCKNDECYMSGQDFNCPAIPCEDCKYSIKFDNFCRHCGRKLK